jgi:hypothetical protein
VRTASRKRRLGDAALGRARALYLGLYAADEDILSIDHFDVTVTGPGGAERTVQLFARGAGADADGTRRRRQRRGRVMAARARGSRPSS